MAGDSIVHSSPRWSYEASESPFLSRLSRNSQSFQGRQKCTWSNFRRTSISDCGKDYRESVSVQKWPTLKRTEAQIAQHFPSQQHQQDLVSDGVCLAQKRVQVQEQIYPRLSYRSPTHRPTDRRQGIEQLISRLSANGELCQVDLEPPRTTSAANERAAPRQVDRHLPTVGKGALQGLTKISRFRRAIWTFSSAINTHSMPQKIKPCFWTSIFDNVFQRISVFQQLICE